jgi:tyrosine-specific transport protein
MQKGVFWAAVATLTGTIIGAGILGIPYTFSKAGLIPGILNIIILGILLLFVNLYLGEVILRTKGKHQLPGYAGKYLGKTGKILMLISSFIFLYGSLIAYTVGEGEVLSFVFFGSVHFTLLFSIIFFAIMAFLVYLGIKALEDGEKFGLIIVSAMILALFFFFFAKIDVSNFTLVSPNPSLWFLPYGVILFAFLALSALPEMREELVKNEKKFKHAIIIGSAIPLILYLLFAVSIYGFAGAFTPEIATLALGRLPCILAIFTMFTAFFALGIALKDVFEYDFKLKKTSCYLLTMIPVLILSIAIILFKLTTFINLLGFIGSVAGGLAGILVLLMVKKAKLKGDRKPEYSIHLNWIIIIILIAIFIAGIIHQFLF